MGPTHTQPHLRRQERSRGKNEKSEFIVTTPVSISFSVIISSLVSLPSLPDCGAPRHSFRRLMLQSGGTRHPSVAKPAHSQTLATGCWTSYHIESTKIRRNFRFVAFSLSCCVSTWLYMCYSHTLAVRMSWSRTFKISDREPVLFRIINSLHTCCLVCYLLHCVYIKFTL